MHEILQGTWDHNTQWQLRGTTELPAAALCTAVFCVAITTGSKIVLARSERGWGLIGGHIEPGETADEALVRESLEEGGFSPDQPQLFGVMEITSVRPVLRQHSTTTYYPFPHSYQLYYHATTRVPLTEPTGEEIIEAQAFSLDAIRRLNTPDYPIVELGYAAYQRSLTT